MGCCRASMPRRSARLARDINVAIAGFIRGQGALCAILGLFYAISLSLLGLNFGFLIGSVAGLISFIPFVGSIVGFVLAVGVAIVQFWPDWHWIVAVVGIFAVGQFIEGNILQPRLVGHEHRRASRVADVRALRLRLAVRLRRCAAGGSGDGGDRRARPLRRRALPAEPRSIWSGRDRPPAVGR